MKSSVETLREQAEQVRRRSLGPVDLTAEQRLEWAPYRVAVLEAQAAEHEYLNSLLERQIDDDERQRIVDDLFQEDVEANGREAAERVDLEHVSDWELVRDHERYLEALAEEIEEELERVERDSSRRPYSSRA